MAPGNTATEPERPAGIEYLTNEGPLPN